MDKFKVGDLIHDHTYIYRVLSVDDRNYRIKNMVGEYKLDYEFNINKLCAEERAQKYDLDNPPIKTIHTGSARCAVCESKLHEGDYCIRFEDKVYCCPECFSAAAYRHKDRIKETDLDSNETKEVPMFNLTKEEIEKLKEAK